MPYWRGWVRVPVPGHVLNYVPRYVLKHMTDKQVLEDVSRRVPKHVLNLLVHADLAAAQKLIAHAVPMN